MVLRQSAVLQNMGQDLAVDTVSMIFLLPQIQMPIETAGVISDCLISMLIIQKELQKQELY
jgi:hypothetical protein